MTDTTDAHQNQDSPKPDPETRYTLASMLFKKGDYKASLSILEDLSGEFPDDKNLQSALQKTKERLSNSPTVIAHSPMSVDDLLGPSAPRYRQTAKDKPKRSWLPWAVGGTVAAAIIGVFGSYFALRDKPDVNDAALAALSQPKVTATLTPSYASSSHGSAAVLPQPDNPSPSDTAHSPYSRTSDNPKWPGLGLPPDFQGTRVGIEPSDYKKPSTFNLDTEVERVLAEVRSGKGVPPVLDTSSPYHVLWKDRSIYQPIIVAARTAFHKHRNPKTGAPGVRSETITVPGNITGKDELRIVYTSGEQLDNFTWGDDEDIIYFTGKSHRNNNDLHILPGTIILVAAHQDDQREGAMPQAMIDDLDEGYRQTGLGDGPVQQKLFHDPSERYFKCTSFQGVGKTATLFAQGKVDRPILILGDRGTPYDYISWGFGRGIMDGVFVGDCFCTNTNSYKTITTRCKFDNLLSTGLGGPGWIIANYFGECGNECHHIYEIDERYYLFYRAIRLTQVPTLCSV